MLCGYPVKLLSRSVPCGQCMPCRINLKRMWTGRILLEAQYSPNRSSFLTLTYNDFNLPADECIAPEQLQGYIKNVRNASRHETIRFFGVGEYGDKFGRPHYHLAMFNMDPVENEELFKKCWRSGFVHVGQIEASSAAYLASYTTKKLTKKGDDRLEGKTPEFSRMSKYPPIGEPGILHIQTLLETRTGKIALKDRGDIPTAFQVGKTQYPIGRYWRLKLREWNGITNPPDNISWVITEEEQENAEKKAAKLYNTRNQTLFNRKTF